MATSLGAVWKEGDGGTVSGMMGVEREERGEGTRGGETRVTVEGGVTGFGSGATTVI